MIVNEKGLIRAMKEAYKSTGYKVAADDTGGQIDIILAGALWTVVVEKSTIPRKVLGLIAEHIGEIPEPGTAYHVKRGETQTEIFNIVTQAVRDFHSGELERRIIWRTNLTLGGYPLWQAATDHKVVKVHPEQEDIMYWSGETVRMIGDDLLFLDDMTSRAYITTGAVRDDERSMLEHLSKIQWPAI